MQDQQKSNGRWKFLALFAICLAPVLLSYFMYYVVKPQARNNYGTLLDPRAYPIPALGSKGLDGKPVALTDYKGKWVMLHVDRGDCNEACRKQLFEMRQLRLMQGKEMDRIERVWLVTDDQPIDTMLLRQYDGMHVLRVDRAALNAWLPTEQGTQAADHIYLIDPLNNLMMRFPKDSDPYKVKKDLARLLQASRIG